MQKSVIIVENNKDISNVIKLVLEDSFESEVVAEHTTKEDLDESYQLIHPDLTLISMDPGNRSEISHAREFICNHPDALTIALTSSNDNVYHRFVREVGFKGFINRKNFSQDFKSTLNILNS